MSKPKPYNGHKSWRHWNVSLWIFNDENLYLTARECRLDRTADEATRRFLAVCPRETPDGARFTFDAVRPCFNRDNWE